MTVEMTSPLTVPLTLLGDPTVTVCVGDSCAIPDRPGQFVENPRLDEDPSSHSFEGRSTA